MFLASAKIIENESMTLFLSVVIPIVTIGLIVIVGWRFLRERKRYRAELASYIEGIETKREINATIGSYISKDPTISFSLLKVDIDKFTDIYEGMGKDEADKIIKNIAFQLLEAVPKRVDVARVDIDQFLIFLKGEYDRSVAIDLAKKIQYIVSTPIKIYSDTSITLSASIAIAFYPAHGSNVKQLTDSLDMAVYTCKRNGGNQFAVYSPDVGEDEASNMELYREIKEGIRNKEFTLYYQPMIDCERQTIYGFEGLLRWNHPKLGVLSPFKFINIMEQSGDINWVGEWGIESLIREYIKLKKYVKNDSFILSLNLSPKQLLDPELPLKFQKIIKKYKIAPSSIVLEIEEFAIYDKNEVIKKNMKDLKAVGFKLGVDGVGLDFNGLKKLEELRVDIVKLDKDYMNVDEDELLKERFISLLAEYAQTNNMSIIAEGVENIEGLKHATSLGVKIVQGYNFSKPMKEEEIVDYINSEDYLKHLA